MPLKSLSEVDQKTANAALASTVLSLGGPGIEFVPSKYAALARAMVEEVRSDLRLNNEDTRPESILRIKDVLSAEVDRRLFAGVDRGSLRTSLGNAGNLPLGAYKVDVGDAFKAEFKREKASFATECVKRADMFVHLADDAALSDKRVSFFAKYVKSLDGKRDYWSIVSAIRDGGAVKVDYLWRVFPDTVRVTDASDPISILGCFLSVYGLKLSVDGGPGRDKLIKDRYVFGDEGNLRVDSDSQVSFLLSVISRRRLLGVNIDLAYAVDTTKYWSDFTRFA